MKKQVAAIAETIKNMELGNNEKVIVGKGFFDSIAHENPRLKLEEFLGACGCYRLKRNLMSGTEIKVAYNTPISCDPSSETYWSM